MDDDKVGLWTSKGFTILSRNSSNVSLAIPPLHGHLHGYTCDTVAWHDGDDDSSSVVVDSTSSVVSKTLRAIHVWKLCTIK
jgi:hypothetical protein